MNTETHIKLIADTLLPGFIPKDINQNELTFHFTIPPANSYKVSYEKNQKNDWVFVAYEAVES